MKKYVPPVSRAIRSRWSVLTSSPMPMVVTEKIDRGHLIKFMHAHHGGENIVITLKVSSDDRKKVEEKPVIIKEIQVHPVNDEILHVDFN